MADLAAASGLDKQVLVFLRDKGVTNSGVLFHLFEDRWRIPTTLAPLRTGVKIRTDELKLDDVGTDVAAAVLEHMIDEVAAIRARQMTAASPAPVSSSSPATGAATIAEQQKAPDQLPKGYWAKRVKEFESEQIEGRNRSFPVHLLVGAEETLARMVYEKEAWAKSDDRFSDSLRLDASGSLVRRDKKIPEPQKALAMLSNLFVGRWSSQGVEKNSIRDRDIPQIREYYRKTSWDLAMHMRAAGSFQEGVEKIITSTERRDALACWMPPDGKGKGKVFASLAGCAKFSHVQPQTTPTQQATPNTTVLASQVFPPAPSIQKSWGTEREACHDPSSPLGKLRFQLPHSSKPQTVQSHTCDTPIALLSFFDGIGSARQSMIDLQIEPIVSWSWELDPECNQVVGQRHPKTVLQGDALSADPQKAVAALQEQCPPGTFVTVACAPPCPDFSRIKGWWHSFRKICPFKFALLLENVTMSKETQGTLDWLLDIKSFVCDAASFVRADQPPSIVVVDTHHAS
ncbi:ftsH [Symbiodinium sp. CCMP2592]|nr:ftsH [Symbiodinium sp. CCMP2592]